MMTRTASRFNAGFIMVVAVVLASTASAATFTDSFEDGLAGWRTDFGGPFTTTAAQAHFGQHSVVSLGCCHSAMSYTEQIFQFGVYEIWGKVTDYAGDVALHFHYQDPDNYYAIGTGPAGTDTPSVSLARRVNGISEVLENVAPPMGRNEWYRITVHRLSDGTIKVFINGGLMIERNDTTFMDSGAVGFRVWGGEAFVDDVLVDEFQVPVEPASWGRIKALLTR